MRNGVVGIRVDTLKAILAQGDKHGSALKEMLRDLKICDLTNVTQEQAEMWLAKKEGGEYDFSNNESD